MLAQSCAPTNVHHFYLVLLKTVQGSQCPAAIGATGNSRPRVIVARVGSRVRRGSGFSLCFSLKACLTIGAEPSIVRDGIKPSAKVMAARVAFITKHESLLVRVFTYYTALVSEL
jgi:hypothetical protein